MTTVPRSQPRDKVVRVYTSTDTKALPEQLNQLFAQVGLPMRDLTKWQTAIEHSLVCVSARQVSDRSLVGFVRASGDEVFNLNVWDFVVDPRLPEPDLTKKLLLSRLKQEIRRHAPQCAVSMFSQANDLKALHQAGFIEDQLGIRAMALRSMSTLWQRWRS